MNSRKHDSTWFVAQLNPNCANIAERNLKRQGFETFLPLEKATQPRGAKFLSVKRPLFPGYIFVAFNEAHGRWRAINSTYGISRLVSFGNKPSKVPRELVDQLRARCVDGALVTASSTFSPRDSVALTTGPFVNFVATVDQILPNQRVFILMDILGRETRMAVGQADIKA